MSKYRPEIDGLRAFSVVAVIINHFNKDLLPSGYLGVDIFFLISGYVITSSLAGRKSKNLLDFLIGFYERRIKRLIPALVLFVLITSVLISLFNPQPETALKTGSTALFGVSNLYLLRQSTDYFAKSTELNPFTHTWSLGVEEQFYLLFPFLIWFSGFGQQTAKGTRNLFFLVGAMAIASLIGFIYLYQINQPAAYFLMPTRFWEMAAGCLLFIGFQKRARIEQALVQVPPLLIFAAMVGVMFLPLSAAVPATIGILVLSAILISSLNKESFVYSLFTHEKVVYVGLISYSLYLWHWTILSLSRWTIGMHWWAVPLQIACMLILAMATHRFVEDPLRRMRWFSTRFPTSLSAIFLLLISFKTSKLIFNFSSHLYLGDTPRGSQTYSERTYWNRRACMGDRQGEIVPDNSAFANCKLGQSTTRLSKIYPQIFWFGDSFNEQLMPAAVKINANTGLEMNSFGVSGCPASLELEYALEKFPGYCSKVFRKYIAFFFASAGHGSTLIVAVNPSYWNVEKDSHSLFRLNGFPLTISQARKFYVDELIRLSDLLSNHGRKLIVTSGIPALVSDPDLCSNYGSSINNACNMNFDSSAFEQNKVFIDLLGSKNLRGKKVNALDLFSPLQNLISESLQPKYVFYYNSTHLSRDGALLLVPVLTDAIGIRK